jgi:hypothetical protein
LGRVVWEKINKSITNIERTKNITVTWYNYIIWAIKYLIVKI